MPEIVLNKTEILKVLKAIDKFIKEYCDVIDIVSDEGGYTFDMHQYTVSVTMFGSCITMESSGDSLKIAFVDEVFTQKMIKIADKLAKIVDNTAKEKKEDFLSGLLG